MIYGVVSWINVVHDIIADNVWKEQAESHYDVKEITEAKDALWKASGGQAGDLVQRQGANKKKMEIEDIHKGLRKLKNESRLPLILSTSGMMARAPNLSGISTKSDIGDVVARVKDLEDSMEAFMKKQSDQIKELTEVVSDYLFSCLLAYLLTYLLGFLLYCLLPYFFPCFFASFLTHLLTNLLTHLHAFLHI